MAVLGAELDEWESTREVTDLTEDAVVPEAEAEEVAPEFSEEVGWWPCFIILYNVIILGSLAMESDTMLLFQNRYYQCCRH